MIGEAVWWWDVGIGNWELGNWENPYRSQLGLRVH
jgi:hypothetical protein